MPGLNTAGDLIAFALRSASINGVGQTPSAEDSNDGLILLRSLVAQWQQKRWLVPSLTDIAKLATGAETYTIGPGLDFNTPRPAKIESAYARFMGIPGPNTVDYPLGIIESREAYNAIGLKNLSTIPLALFYESAYPAALLHFWPVPPSGQYELHISTKAALPTYASLTDPIGLPAEYTEALIYSLAVRFAINWGLDPRPAHVMAMQQALNTIRQANFQIPQMAMPAGIPGRSRRGGLAAGSDPSFQSGGMV
jgi:hypothetical protein